MVRITLDATKLPLLFTGLLVIGYLCNFTDIWADMIGEGGVLFLEQNDQITRLKLTQM